MEPGMPTPVIITYFTGQVLHLRDQDAAGVAIFLKKAAGLKPGVEARRARRLRRLGDAWRRCREIAEAKMKDLNANDVEAAMQIIPGSARSMGIEVKG